MENATIKYRIVAKSAEDAIDMKNAILLNTTDKEVVNMDISINEAYLIT